MLRALRKEKRPLVENSFETRVGTQEKFSSQGEKYCDAAWRLGRELVDRPLRGGGADRIRIQHAKGRMPVWERLEVLTDQEPTILWRNWGSKLDGASIVTGILEIGGRDVAV